MIILRLMLFVGLVVQNELLERWEFILFYVFLGVVFFLHNIIRKKEYKLATFINLAFLRYIAPFVFLVESKNLLVIIPSIFLNYVFYRSISYLESKNLVVFPERKGGMFKLSYYSLILPCSLLLSVFVGNYLPLFINLYYLFFWVLFWIKNNLVKSGKV